METLSGREMGTFQSFGRKFPHCSCISPRGGQFLLTVGDAGHGRRQTAGASASVCLGGNALDRADVLGAGPRFVVPAGSQGSEAEKGETHLRGWRVKERGREAGAETAPLLTN